MNPRQRQNEILMEERRTRVADLYCQRQTTRQIAAVLEVDHGTIVRDLAVLRARWRERATTAVAERAAEELRRIDHLEEITWKAWERSCQDRETLKARKVKGRTTRDGDPLPDLDTTEKTVSGQAGDPRFLERVAWCVQKRCEMLGILKAETGGVTTVTTVVNKVDLKVILGQEPGIPMNRLGSVSSN